MHSIAVCVGVVAVVIPLFALSIRAQLTQVTNGVSLVRRNHISRAHVLALDPGVGRTEPLSAPAASPGARSDRRFQCGPQLSVFWDTELWLCKQPEYVCIQFRSPVLLLLY
jgi:hypothetical protein